MRRPPPIALLLIYSQGVHSFKLALDAGFGHGHGRPRVTSDYGGGQLLAGRYGRFTEATATTNTGLNHRPQDERPLRKHLSLPSMTAAAAVSVHHAQTTRGGGITSYITTTNQRAHPFMNADFGGKRVAGNVNRKGRLTGGGARSGGGGGGGGGGDERLGPLRAGREGSILSGYSTRTLRNAVGVTGRFKSSVWTKAAFHSDADDAQRFPSIRLSADGPATVVHSGAVGAYIRKTMAGRRNSTTIGASSNDTPSPCHSDPGPGGRNDSGGRSDAGCVQPGSVHAPPTFHKSPNAAVLNPDPFQRTPQQRHHKGTGGLHGHAGGSGARGWGTQHVGGSGAPSVIGGGQHVSGLSTAGSTPGAALGQHAGGLGGGRTGGVGPAASSNASSSNPRFLTHHAPSTSSGMASGTLSHTSSTSFPHHHPHHLHPQTQDRDSQRFKAVPWNKYNRDLLHDEVGVGGGGAMHRLSPLPGPKPNVGRFSPTTNPAAGSLRSAVSHNTGGVRGEIDGANMMTDAKGSFHMLEFRSSTKEPRSTQHRTFTFNLSADGQVDQDAGVRQLGIPSSESTPSPSSLDVGAESVASTSPSNLLSEEGYESRSRKCSVSNELAPGMKQLLRTSNSKRGDVVQKGDTVKRRKVEFREESPEVCDMEAKEPVIAISEKLDLDRSPLPDEALKSKPPKSILKKRSDRIPIGEIRFAKKYQALEQQSSFKLPSINIDVGSMSLTGKNTKINSGRNTNFTCSREFAAVFENVNDEGL